MTGKKNLKLGIIGWPLGYSLSPVMQKAALDAVPELAGSSYEEIKVEPKDLESWLAQVLDLGLNGFNVTMPHKESAFFWLKSSQGKGRIVRAADDLTMAVNTVKIEKDHLYGYNTDGEGFMDSVKDRDIALGGKRVLLLGAGGAAQAIAIHLATEHVDRVAVWNRTADRAEKLMNKVNGYLGNVTEKVESLSELETKDFDLIVNCTPVGMGNQPQSLLQQDQLHAHQIVYDIVYEPKETPLVQMARQRCKTVITGDEMLARQGAAAFELWTGVGQMYPVMKKALDEYFASDH